jgi:hypothetical protein
VGPTGRPPQSTREVEAIFGVPPGDYRTRPSVSEPYYEGLAAKLLVTWRKDWRFSRWSAECWRSDDMRL